VAAPKQFKLADFDYQPEDMGLFCIAEIDWSEPKKWDDDADEPPLGAADQTNALYLILRDHWRQTTRHIIRYVGMTTDLPRRFNNHPCADRLKVKRGSTLLSVGSVSYSGRHSRWANNNPGLALRQIEHILIWALSDQRLVNDKNQNSLPVVSGKNIAYAKPWIIRRTGHRFHGAMPREIIFPWMAIKRGRRSAALEGTA